MISSLFLDHSGIKSEINTKRNTLNHTNTWKPKNSLLNDLWVNNKVKAEIKIYFKTKENRDTTYKIIWDAAKAVLRRTFLVLNAYIKKIERSQINNLTLHLKELENQKQTKPKASTREKKKN